MLWRRPGVMFTESLFSLGSASMPAAWFGVLLLSIFGYIESAFAFGTYCISSNYNEKTMSDEVAVVVPIST